MSDFNNNTRDDIGDLQGIYTSINPANFNYYNNNNNTDPFTIRYRQESLVASNTTSIIENTKILCLHGGGGNSLSFETTINNSGLINLIPDVSFHFIDAPYNNGLWIKDGDGPDNSDGKSTTSDPLWANESVLLISNYIINHGPFQGILGYSQGAAFIVSFLAQSKFKFDFVMLFGGYLPTTHNGIMQTINNHTTFDVKTFIYSGLNDPFYNNDLSNKFSQSTDIRPQNAEHEFPTFTNNNNLINDLTEWFF